MKKNTNTISIIEMILSIVAFYDTFMPLAASEGYFVNFWHIGGMGYTLPLLPWFIFIPSVLYLYKVIEYPKWWYIGTGFLGFIETIYLTVVAVEHLKSFTHHSASIGLGGAAILVYLIIAVLGTARLKTKFPLTFLSY